LQNCESTISAPTKVGTDMRSKKYTIAVFNGFNEGFISFSYHFTPTDMFNYRKMGTKFF